MRIHLKLGDPLTSAGRMWNTLVLEINLSVVNEADLIKEIPERHHFIFLCNQNQALVSWHVVSWLPRVKQQQCKACSGTLGKVYHQWLCWSPVRPLSSDILEAWQKWVWGKGKDLNPNSARQWFQITNFLIWELLRVCWRMPCRGCLLICGFGWKWVAASWTCLGVVYRGTDQKQLQKQSLKC